MLPHTLPATDFKKDYKFLWFINGSSDNDDWGISETSGNFDLDMFRRMKHFTLDNLAYCNYVSQLAEEIKLPDDEFEIEQMPNGPVTYEIPKKVKLANIQVTYLEDSLNSVYNFHKTWFEMIRGGTGLYFNPPTVLCASAKYVEFENTLTTAEYMLYFQSLNDLGINRAGSVTPTSLLQKVTNAMSTLKPEIPVGAKPTGITTYPRLYPTRISRSPANKSGTGLHKVTVTYSRIPTFKKNHTNLQILSADETEWKDKRS